MGYNISELEGQNGGRDWPLIVSAVECSVCGAPLGEMCRSVGVAGINTLMHGMQRIDWHAERKQAAAHAWYTRAEAAKQPETTSPGNGEQGEPATAQSDVAHETPGEPHPTGKETAAAEPAEAVGEHSATTGPVVEPVSTIEQSK